MNNNRPPILQELPYLDIFRDRLNKIRIYFRRTRDTPRYKLPNDPDTAEFMERYYFYRNNRHIAEATAANTDHGTHGTFRRIVFLFKNESTHWNTLSDRRRKFLDGILDYIDRTIGDLPMRSMSPADIERLMLELKSTPSKANELVYVLKELFRHSRKQMPMWTRYDPTTDVDRFVLDGEYRPWTDEEIAAFETRWPLGSPERTALALYLYTGQRSSDVTNMRWSDLRNDRISVTQVKKSRKQKKVRLLIPVHYKLRKALETTPRSDEFIIPLNLRLGSQRSTRALSSMFSKAIDAAGLAKDVVGHGLRKSSCRRLAEAGCTPHQIMAISGHITLALVDYYTQEAKKPQLAMEAMNLLEEQERRRAASAADADPVA